MPVVRPLIGIIAGELEEDEGGLALLLLLLYLGGFFGAFWELASPPQLLAVIGGLA